jgi:hypothetical protein
MLWVWILIRARCTTLCDKVSQWLVTGLWFSPGPPVSSTNKTDRHDITEILLKSKLFLEDWYLLYFLAYCAPGKERDDATGNCVDCLIGFYKHNNNNLFMNCTACPDNYVTAATMSTSTDVDCVHFFLNLIPTNCTLWIWCRLCSFLS